MRVWKRSDPGRFPGYRSPHGRALFGHSPPEFSRMRTPCWITRLPQAWRLTVIEMSDDPFLVPAHPCLSPKKWALAVIRRFAHFGACSLMQRRIHCRRTSEPRFGDKSVIGKCQWTLMCNSVGHRQTIPADLLFIPLVSSRRPLGSSAAGNWRACVVSIVFQVERDGLRLTSSS